MNAEKQQVFIGIVKNLWSAVDKLRSTLDTVQYKCHKVKENNCEDNTLKITSVVDMIDQNIRQEDQILFKSWFIDFEPTRAKISAKKRWIAINDIIETSSPTCYAGESDYFNSKTKKRTLNEAMTQAAIAVISGESIEEIEQLSTEQLAELTAAANLFPDALVDSEVGEIPLGWRNQTVEGLIESLITSIAK
tara:strand:- start:18 stop:593 length:576 start_codon:yes stop_codon:yes gene_type:complete